MKKSKQLQEVNLQDLRDTCQGYIDFIASDDFHEDNDYDHYIFEKAMEALYGKNVWKYINGKLLYK